MAVYALAIRPSDWMTCAWRCSLCSRGRSPMARTGIHRGGLSRDDLAKFTQDGLTLQRMAERSNCSVTTVRYWLTRYGLPTSSRGLGRRAVLICEKHNIVRRRRGRGFFCPKCDGEAVRNRMRRLKEILVGERGGGCERCGYDECVAALQFHHRDPNTKEFTISGRSWSLERLRPEVAKCDLLCANCHAEVEWNARHS